MSTAAKRYMRQTRLAEIGEAGQARILAYRAELPRGEIGDVAALYLIRAGANVTRGEEGVVVSPGSVARGEVPMFGEAKQFADGAWLALEHIADALGLNR